MEKYSTPSTSQPTEFVHPQGFLSLAKNVGIKDNALDLTVIYSTVRARATNERAIRLYLKLGFIEEGRFRKRVRLRDGELVDDIAMAWFPDR